jgi:hypothetical protein
MVVRQLKSLRTPVLESQQRLKMDDLIHMQSCLVYVCDDDDDDDFNQSARYPDRFSTVHTFTACSSTISINIIIPYTTASPKRFLLAGSLFYDPFSVTTLYSVEKKMFFFSEKVTD